MVRCQRFVGWTALELRRGFAGLGWLPISGICSIGGREVSVSSRQVKLFDTDSPPRRHRETHTAQSTTPELEAQADAWVIIGRDFSGLGSVDAAADFVSGDGLAFHDPFEGRLAGDDAFVGGERDVLDGLRGGGRSRLRPNQAKQDSALVLG